MEVMRSPVKTDELTLALHLSFTSSLDGVVLGSLALLYKRRVKTDELHVRVAFLTSLASLDRLRATLDVAELHVPFRKGF